MTDSIKTSLEQLTTEARNPLTQELDNLSALEIVNLINSEDAKVADAVAEVSGSIAQAIEVIADRLSRGGRLIYVGAGTSGRLGVLDAVECPPTFNTEPELVIGLIIFTVGMRSMTSLQGQLIRSQAEASVRSVTTNIAEEQDEILKGVGLIDNKTENIIQACTDKEDKTLTVKRGKVNLHVK